MTRRASIIVAVALLALAAPALALATPALAAKRAPVVGKVTALSGTLQVRDGKKLRALHKGDKITLGQRLVVGKGVKATLTLKRPNGVAKGTELVRFAPVKGAKPIIRARLRHGVITVQIAPR